MLGGDLGAGVDVACLGGGVAPHACDHHPGVGQRSLLGGLGRDGDEFGGGIGPAPQEVEHQAPEAAKNRARGDSSPSRSSARMCRWMLWQVQGLACHLQPPHVGLETGVGVEQVRGDLVQPRRQA